MNNIFSCQRFEEFVEERTEDDSFHEHNYIFGAQDLKNAHKNVVIALTEGYRIEMGGLHENYESYLQEQDSYSCNYKRYFCDREHTNLIGGSEGNPLVISLLSSEIGGCRAIVRTRERDHHMVVPHARSLSALSKTLLRECSKTDASAVQVKLMEVNSKDLAIALRDMEAIMHSLRHKVGVVYCKPGQTNEEEMFANVDTSPEFDEFLELLGPRVRMKGFDKFAAGLDCKSDSTGKESIYTKFGDCEIMFHVATLLPYSPHASQQVEKKRHIGNDVVVIVFQDSADTPYAPDTITSKFNHVVIVVQVAPEKIEGRTAYRVGVVSKPGVAAHAPVLPRSAVFEHGDQFREFLLTKCVNAERAGVYAPPFFRTRTRKQKLEELIERFQDEAASTGCF